MVESTEDLQRSGTPAAPADERLGSLAAELLRAFDHLQLIDFGELEPVGIASPTDIR